MGRVRIRPVAASVAAWSLGAAAAVSVGLIALSLIGDGLSAQAGQPFAPNALDQPLVTMAPTPSGVSPSGSARPTGSATPTPEATVGRSHTVASNGGTVVARCQAAGAYLVGWSPAPTYRTDDVQRGPALVVFVAFEGPREVKIFVRCVNGVVQPTIHDEPGGPGDT